MSKKIAICDDDQIIRGLIAEYLLKYDYQTFLAQDGTSLLSLLESTAVDLILLDLMLPGEDGLSLCRKIRTSSSVPIIMITAVDEDIDRVAALELGADYYVTKPLNMRVLMAYIKSVLRRQYLSEKNNLISNQGVIYSFYGWKLKVTERLLLTPSQITVTLSYGEFQILHALIKTPRCVLSRQILLDAMVSNSSDSFDRSIDVLMSRLRRKLSDHSDIANCIKTIRNVGYVFEGDVEKLCYEKNTY